VNQENEGGELRGKVAGQGDLTPSLHNEATKSSTRREVKEGEAHEKRKDKGFR